MRIQGQSNRARNILRLLKAGEPKSPILLRESPPPIHVIRTSIGGHCWKGGPRSPRIVRDDILIRDDEEYHLRCDSEEAFMRTKDDTILPPERVAFSFCGIQQFPSSTFAFHTKCVTNGRFRMLFLDEPPSTLIARLKVIDEPSVSKSWLRAELTKGFNRCRLESPFRFWLSFVVPVIESGFAQWPPVFAEPISPILPPGRTKRNRAQSFLLQTRLNELTWIP